MPRSLPLLLALAYFSAAPLCAQRARPTSFAPTPGTGTFTVLGDLEYARVANTSLKLDLYLPDSPGPHPVILWLHAGAWITGDRTGGPAIRQARRGYAVASIDYRLAPDFVFPAQIDDCKAAVRWLRANAATYHLDPERVGVFGASAGGHLAALLGTSGGVSSLEDLAMGNPQYSSRVQAVVDFYGPSDLLKLEEDELGCVPLSANSPYAPPSLLIGCPIQECREKAERASPIHYITSDDPPFLILHGTKDCLVPWQQSVLLDEALKRGGINSTLAILPGAEHGGDAFDAPEYKQMISDFFDRYLKQRADRRRPVSHP